MLGVLKLLREYQPRKNRNLVTQEKSGLISHFFTAATLKNFSFIVGPTYFSMLVNSLYRK